MHELPDQRATMRTVCKWAERIDHIADAPAIIDEAVRQMLSGRPGPVCVEMAWDVMAASDEVAILPPAVLPQATPPDADAIARAADLLAGAKQPMIFLGSGAQGAADDVRALAKMLGAPVTAFRGGRGIVPETHELGLSCYAASTLWPQVDVALGIGTRMELPFMRWANMMALSHAPDAPPPHVIRVDIDPTEHERLKVHVPITADAGDGTRALLAALRARNISRKNTTHLATTKAKAAEAIKRVTPHVDYLNAIRGALPADGFFVEELCQAGFTSYFAWEVEQPRTYVSPGFQGTLGFGFMTALGVKAAHPDRAVVSISGDGGFLFGVGELATAAQYGLGVVALFFNNDAYGNVLRDQQRGFGGRLLGSELKNPDFVALARSFGIAAERVTSPDDLARVLRNLLAANQPALVEVVVDRTTEVPPWPLIHPNMPLPAAR